MNGSAFVAGCEAAAIFQAIEGPLDTIALRRSDRA